MHDLPHNIEQYLTESGFSPTEILILRKLMEERALTLRELAARAGKSTGVLDQAMKKLMRKKIVTRETINDAPKYVLVSTDAINAWVKREAIQQREIIKRKQENFESFMATIEKDQARPEIQHYHGLEGLRAAYEGLLDIGDEQLCYKPITLREEDDPLHDFYVQYFRRRHSRNVFLRTIAQNSPLARRYKSRDSFEYRDTMLRNDIAPGFEKIICGDTIACLNHIKQTASHIRYPELAEVERGIFEAEWRRLKVEAKEPAPKVDPAKPEVDATTKLLSTLREFFLSKRSLVVMAAFVLASGGFTYAAYLHNYDLNLKRTQEKLMSIAVTGALQFDTNDLAELHTITDTTKPVYAKVVGLLNNIREQNKDILYAYIMRPTAEEGVWEFVADADSLDPYTPADINKDGLIDDKDQITPTGFKYNAMQNGAGSNKEALIRPINIGPEIDEWGEIISSWAPIRDHNGETVAIIGIDKFADDVDKLTSATFQPFYYFFGLLFLFVFIRLAAYNQSLYQELKKFLWSKNVIGQLGVFVVISAIITAGIYYFNYHQSLQRIREQVQAIAATGALQFSPDEFNEIHNYADIKRPEYAEIIRKLNAIRNQNDGVRYIYILRPTETENLFTFVADADSLDPMYVVDANNDGIINQADQNAPPGQEYEASHVPAMWEALEGPTSSRAPYSDQWGTFISGFAPIRDARGETVAILGVDKWADEVKKLASDTFAPILTFFVLLFAFIFVRLIALNPSLLKELVKFITSKNVIRPLLIFAALSMIVTYGMYRHNIYLNTQRIREHVMGIAATGASRFDWRNIDEIYTKDDLRKPIYKEMADELMDIRRLNPDIVYAYILRPTGSGTITNFIVDPDALLPEGTDITGDGIVDEKDAIPYPEETYEVTASPEYWKEILEKPTADRAPVKDNWGIWISGFAPIKNDAGKTVAILGIDRKADDIYELTHQTFKPIYWFISILLLSILVFAISNIFVSKKEQKL